MQMDKVTLLLGSLWIFSCGISKTDHASRVSHSDDLTYKEWCDDWALTCPEQNPSLPPIPDDSYTWLAINKTLKHFLETDTNIFLSSDQWQETVIADSLKEMKLSWLHDRVTQLISKTTMQNFQFSSHSKMQMQFSRSEAFTLGSGLMWLLEDSIRMFPLDRGGAMGIEGVKWSPEFAPEESYRLREVTYTGSNYFDLAFDSFSVRQVPVTFIQSELGLIGEIPDSFAFESLLYRIGDFLQLVAYGENKLSLDQTFFRKLSDSLEVIEWPDRQLLIHIQKFLEKLESIESASDKLAIYGKLTERKSECRLSMKGIPPMKIQLLKSFGIENISSFPDRTEIEIYGVKTKIDIPGPADPTFKLRKLAITKEHMIIGGIPVIGELKVPLKEKIPPNPKELTLKCS